MSKVKDRRGVAGAEQWIVGVESSRDRSENGRSYFAEAPDDDLSIDASLGLQDSRDGFRTTAASLNRPFQIVTGAGLLLCLLVALSSMRGGEGRPAMRADAYAVMQQAMRVGREAYAEMGQVGGDAAAGARAALEDMHFALYFASEGSPDALLAVTSSAIVLALREGATSDLRVWTRRLSSIEGAEEDYRAAMLRGAVVRYLLSMAVEEGDKESMARLFRMLSKEEGIQAMRRHRVGSTPWSQPMLSTLLVSLDVLRNSPRNVSDAYLLGYRSVVDAVQSVVSNVESD